MKEYSFPESMKAGPAARDEALRAGQRILEVNGRHRWHWRYTPRGCQGIIKRSVGDKMTILVCDQPPEKSETSSPAELSSPSSHKQWLPFIPSWDLPNSIGKLKNLHNLNVDRNRLTEIPVEIGKCKQIRLEYLPFTIANLNLKALWLSENQAQPMLKFQTDFDERTGQRVFTCFLLPQQGKSSLKGSIATEGSFTDKDKPRDSVIRFAEDSDKIDNEEDTDSDSSHFVRHDTPHPKELKARHSKFLKDKNIDGHVIPHHENREDDRAFLPSRDHEARYSDDDSEAPGPYYRDSLPPAHFNSTYTKSPSREEKFVPRPPEIIKAPELEGPPPPSIPSESSSSEDEELPQESHPLLTTKTVTVAPAPTVRIAANEVEELDVEDDRDDSGSERARHSSGDNSEEESVLRDKKVEFAPDVDEDLNKDHRLRRRDTPHYLKNKRVNKEDDAEQKVLEILAQVSKQRETAALSPVVKPPELEVITSPPPATQQMPVEVQEEEFNIRIIREPGQGLGISIAGGKGSTPVKGNDESIFISRVTEEGPAGKAGIVKGDKLLKVNNESLIDADHYTAVNVLKNSGNDITMVVAREKLVANAHAETLELGDTTHDNVTTVSFTAEPEAEVYGETVTTALIRDHTGLGFSIAGGRGAVPFKGNDSAIYISKITPGGTADKDGVLKVGDRIVSINDVDMADARHDQAVALLTGLDRTIKLVVYREKIVPKGEGFEPPPPGSQRIPNITQPVINWQQSSTPPARTPSPVGAQLPPRLSPSSASAVSFQAPSATLPAVSSPLSPAGKASGSSPSSCSPNRYSGIEAGPTMTPPSPFSAAVPTSYSYLNQPTITTSVGQTSPSPVSPKFGAKSLSTDWSVPPASVQPPKFVYPGFSKTTSTTTASISLPSAPSISIPPSSPSPVQATSARNSTTLPPSQTLTMPAAQQVPRSPTSSISTSLTRASAVDSGVAKVLNLPSMSVDTPDDSPESNHVEMRSHSPQPYPVEDITIVKAGGPLGLSIVGGVDHSSQPFGGDDPGVFVSKIVKDGAASKTNLRIGDRILSVNNKDLKHATHEEAVMALISPTYEIHLKVRHDPPPPGLQNCEATYIGVLHWELLIVKEASEKLGLSIKGGAKNLATPNRSDEGIFISRINDGGAAARDGRLRAGQRILEVNGTSLLGATHQEAVRALRSVGDKMTILVCDQPPEKSETSSPAELSSPSSQGGFLSSLHGSVSSIDREDEEARILQQELNMLKETEEWELEHKVKLRRLNEPESPLVTPPSPPSPPPPSPPPPAPPIISAPISSPLIEVPFPDIPLPDLSDIVAPSISAPAVSSAATLLASSESEMVVVPAVNVPVLHADQLKEMVELDRAQIEVPQQALSTSLANQSVMTNQVPLKPPVPEKPLNSLAHVKKPDPQPGVIPVLIAPKPFSTTSTVADSSKSSTVLMGPKPFTISPRPSPFSKSSTLVNSQPSPEVTVPRPVVLPKPAPFAPPPKIAPKPVVFRPGVPTKHEAQDSGDHSSPISSPENVSFDVRKSARVPSGTVFKVTLSSSNMMCLGINEHNLSNV
ncbi:hypothetical protein Btru_026900 [Bulinus truncatus]|nr:hypothetical protein Btru_026900 [Bulinus truncatus]